MEKVTELKTVVGKDCSCNYSPTHRSKLVKVGKNVCTLEVTATMYSRNQWSNIHVGKQFTQPTYIVHNQYFFQAMRVIQVTLQERWAATRGVAHKSKKSYTRKPKHKGKGSGSDCQPPLPKATLQIDFTSSNTLDNTM